MGSFRDLTGQVVGRWTVLDRAENRISRGGFSRIYWRCRCICGTEKDVIAISLVHALNQGRVKGTSHGCKKCGYDNRESRYSTPRQGNIYSKYRLSPDRIKEILERQNHQCAVCGTPITENAHVNHDHGCCSGNRSCGKCVRGFLCSYCNKGLGMFRDSLRIIEKALSYLKGSLNDIPISRRIG